MTWLPEGFEPPARLELQSGHHLRPIHPFDTDLDYPAVMGSQARLWETFGAAWGWPTTTMTREQDRADLVRHAEEMLTNTSFNYAIFDRDETVLLGCVYLDPPAKTGADAEVSWWVVDDEVGGDLEQALRSQVPAWIDGAWPFTEPRIIGLDLTWDDYVDLPDCD